MNGCLDKTSAETLLFALIRRFVRRIVIMDPEGLTACRGKPVIFLAVHQVGIKPILFNLLIPGFGGNGEPITISTFKDFVAPIRESLVAFLESLPKGGSGDF